jgi:hypothetical protein
MESYPVEPNDGKPIHPDDDGSIDRIVARLVRWGTRASDGLARVEYDSEFARRRAVDVLRTAFAKADVAFCEVDASEPDTSAAEAARAIIDGVTAARPGVVSLAISWMNFVDDAEVDEAVRALNFNRENLARPGLRIVWWMPPSVAQRFIVGAPDLNSWFIVRHHLTETVQPPPPKTHVEAPRSQDVTANVQYLERRCADVSENLEILYAKLSAFEKELIVTADPSRKFEMRSRIYEIRDSIRQLEAERSNIVDRRKLDEIREDLARITALQAEKKRLQSEIEDLPRNEFIRLLRKRLSLSEVRTLWFAVFGARLEDDFPGRNLDESVAELYRRAEERGLSSTLLAELRAERPDIFSNF